MEHKDFRGLTICQGDLICYSTKGSTTVNMYVATVEDLLSDRLRVRKANGKRVVIHCFQNIAVLGRN